MNSPPTVSVVIPYHNEGELVRNAIESVVSQEFDGSLEVLVVDDHSTEKPAAEYVDSGPFVRLLRTQTPLHAAGARNFGIEQAEGQFVSFLDADDVYLPDRLAAHIGFLRQHPDVVMVGASLYIHRGAERLHVPLVIQEQFPALVDVQCVLPDSIRHHVCTEFFFHTGTMTIRRPALEEIGGFDPTFRWAAEWDLQVRLAQLGKIGYIPQPAQRYLCRSGSITSTTNPVKFESGARMFRKWRRTLSDMPPAYRRLLRQKERRQLLLAAEIYLEREGRPGKALSCSLAAMRRGPSWWGIRSLVRMSLHACLPFVSGGKKSAVQA